MEFFAASTVADGGYIVAAKKITNAITAAMGMRRPGQSLGAFLLAANMGLSPGRTHSNTNSARPPTNSCSQSAMSRSGKVAALIQTVERLKD